MSKLAALVATKVMGWTVTLDHRDETANLYQDTHGNVYHAGSSGRYMPDISYADAIEVFDKFAHGRIIKESQLGDGMYLVDLGEGEADNANLCIAICLAALREVGMTDAEIGEALR